MKHLLTALFVAVAVAAPTVRGFGLPGGARAGGKRSPPPPPSPRLDDALSSYPFVIKSDEERAALSGNFNELARLYGDDEALGMVRTVPRALKFRRENFQKCLDSWTEQFGPEGARAMVARNPGLLGVRPEQTDGAEASMAFSYVVAALRPSLPKLVALVGLLAVSGGKLYEFKQVIEG